MNPASTRRSRRTPTEWAELVERASQSSLSTKCFCHQAGVSVTSLYAWRAKLKAAPKARGFTPVVVAPKGARPTEHSRLCNIEIVLRNGRIVRVRDSAIDVGALRSVIEAAEGLVAC